MYGSKTEVSYMVWATFFIKQNVPVRPTYHAVIKIMYHGAAIALAQFPIGKLIEFEGRIASFSKQQVFAGETFMNSFDIVKYLVSPTPIFIPVKTYTPCISRGCRIFQ